MHYTNHHSTADATIIVSIRATRSMAQLLYTKHKYSIPNLQQYTEPTRTINIYLHTAGRTLWLRMQLTHWPSSAWHVHPLWIRWKSGRSGRRTCERPLLPISVNLEFQVSQVSTYFMFLFINYRFRVHFVSVGILNVAQFIVHFSIQIQWKWYWIYLQQYMYKYI